jgi:hypothetical protein
MNTALKEELSDMKKMISEMHSVIFGNHCTNTQAPPIAAATTQETKNKEDVLIQATSRESEQTDAYLMLMAQQKKAPGADHFKDCRGWKLNHFISEVVKERYRVEVVGASTSLLPSANTRVRAVWQAILQVCNTEEKLMLTFKTDIPSVEHIDYKAFSKNLDAMALNISKRLITEKKRNIKESLEKRRVR